MATPPITWTCDPPEFAAYVSHITAVDAGDFVRLDIDMRCKRVPTHPQIRRIYDDTAQDYTNLGLLDVEFNTMAGTSIFAAICWPEDLGAWAGPRPIITFDLGGRDMEVEFSSGGRYTTQILLQREHIMHDATEVHRADGMQPTRPDPATCRPTLAEDIATIADKIRGLVPEATPHEVHAIEVQIMDLYDIADALDDEAAAVQRIELARPSQGSESRL